MNKKGEGMSITVIVTAAIAVLVLVVLVLVFTGKMGWFGGAIQRCESNNGVCVEDMTKCPTGGIYHPKYTCGDKDGKDPKKYCCIQTAVNEV